MTIQKIQVDKYITSDGWQFDFELQAEEWENRKNKNEDIVTVNVSYDIELPRYKAEDKEFMRKAIDYSHHNIESDPFADHDIATLAIVGCVTARIV